METYFRITWKLCSGIRTQAATASISGNFTAMDDDDDGGGDPCTITSLTQPFYVTIITQSVNHAITITWQSCQFFRYLVFSASVMSTNMQWAPQAYVWGSNGASVTTWTDTATTNDDGSTVTQRFYRVQRILGSPIAAGENHSLAISMNGTLWAWGDNSGEQLGDGTIAGYQPAFFPMNISSTNICQGGISNVVAVAGGDEYSVAADNVHGVVWTWGDVGNGELGNGQNYSTNSPAPIARTSNIVSVAAGSAHTLALRADGAVFAWGSDSSGQLGVGGLTGYTSTNSPVRSLISTETVIVAIAAGDEHSVALDTGGNVWTWGNNDGALGNGEDSSCGGSNRVAIPTILTTISNVIAIAAGYEHSIALTADKTVWTWGDDNYGELGRTSTYDPCDDDIDPLPGQIPPSILSNVVAIAGGNEFTLAVTSNGQVYAWGDNLFNELGTFNTSEAGADGVDSTNSPMLVAGISDAVLVSAHPDGYHVMVLTVDQGTNHYWGWGLNEEGQVGTTSLMSHN